MNRTKRILSVFTVMLFILSIFTLSAYAATSGVGGGKLVTITVVTKANKWVPGRESITLSQTKGVAYTNPQRTKTGNKYGSFLITATPVSGKSTKKVTSVLSGSSVKVNLAPDTTYNVTVSWSPAPNHVVIGWKTYPSWKVSGSCKCTYN